MRLRNNNGITLIALIITIIILLLLAGIVIIQITGDNGLFMRAKQAKNNTLDAQNAENMTIAYYENKINSVVNGSREQITVDKEEYENLKQSVEYQKYNNVEDVIEINSNVKTILESEVKRQGKVASIYLFISLQKNLSAGQWLEIGTLKDNHFIPETDQWGYLAQGTNIGNFAITKEGIIKIRSSSTSIAFIGNITYFTK